jgi:Uma2 family endonuclease
MIHRTATIEDLLETEGKAELVRGEIKLMPPAGDEPSSASNAVASSLRVYMLSHSGGRAYGDGAGFLVNLPERRSFSPDAAWYTGPRSGMRFLPEAPAFAAEIRSENDYGPAAEDEIAAKRADYFAAGTLVVWDVDLRSDDVVSVYRADAPLVPKIYRRGEVAEAEPAVPGWRMKVEELFL